MTNDELHNLLKQRGLIIDDETILHNVNYSHLIYKFGKHYLNDNFTFKPGTTITNIYNLYILNMNISAVLYKFISKFEHKLRVAVVEEISIFGALSYLDKSIYRADENLVNDMILKLSELEEKIRFELPNEKLINGKVPLWILVDRLSIGTISWFIKLTAIDKLVGKRLKIDVRNFNILQTVREFRNLIYHANPLTKVITNTHKNGNITHHYLRSLYMFIKNRPEYREEYKKIEKILSETSTEKIGFTSEELLERLI